MARRHFNQTGAFAVFHALRENLSSEDHFRTNSCLHHGRPLNFSKRKLVRRDATGFKKLPHPDDFLLWQIAMSVRECSGTSIEHHTDSIAGPIVHLSPQVVQEMYVLFETNIGAERVSE